MELTAFGETKPLVAWLYDPRCAVSYATLCARLRLGWRDEDAIAKPVTAPNRGTPRRTIVTLDRQCRLVLPVWARRHLGLQEGDSLAVDVTDEAIVLVPTPWS